MDQTALEFLQQRRSPPSRLLGEPGPDREQLLRILDTAARVPDHGRLQPWRFLRIAGEARSRLGDRLAHVYATENPDAPTHAFEKERSRFAHAPTVVAVIARISPGHRIPEIEQRLSGGAICFQLLLAAQAHGFRAQWLTGWAAYHPDIHRSLGLAEHEEILGFVHIGSCATDVPERDRPDVSLLLADWSP